MLDCLKIYNNIVGPGGSYSGNAAFNINGGHDNEIYNNLVIDVPRLFCNAIYDDFSNYIAGGTTNGTVGYTLRQVWDNPLYTEKWPWMAAAYNGETDFYIPNNVHDNVLVYTDVTRDGWYSLSYNQGPVNGLDSNLIIQRDYTSDNRQLFVDYENGDYRLVDSVLAQIPGFQNIDQSNMGLHTFTYDGNTLYPGGKAPTVSNVTITGTVEVGEEISVSYDYSDPDGNAEGTTYVNYFISENGDDLLYINWQQVSANNTLKSFVITPECETLWIRAKVVPVDSNGVNGDPVWSAPVKVVFTSNVDTTELDTMLAEAKDMVANAVVGNEPGQWSEKEMTLINEAITAAEALLAREELTQAAYDSGLEEFTAAYERFKANKIAQEISNIQLINPLLQNTANWATKSGTAPTFQDGSLTITSGTSAVMTGYTASTFKNKVFSFKYKQTLRDATSAWNAIYLTAGTSIDYPWNNIGVMVVMKNGSIELQFRGASDMSATEGAGKFTKTGDFIKNDVEYDITFGMYAINSTDVRAIMTIDGVEVYNQTITMPDLVTAEVYFGTYVDASCAMTISGTEPRDLSMTPFLKDTANWATMSGAEPTFENGSLAITSDTSAVITGYTARTFENKVFSFKYKQTLKNTTSAWNAICLTGGTAIGYPWSNIGVLLVTKNGSLELQFRGASDMSATEGVGKFTKTGDFIKNDVEYDITFGVYAVNSTDVRAVLTIDGVEIYNQTITMPDLVNAELYFGTYVDAGCTMTIGAPDSNEITIDPYMVDILNWASSSGSTPKIKDGVLTLATGTSADQVGYNGTTFKNKLMSFKYTQTLTLPEEDNNPDNDPWGGIYFTVGSSTAAPWNPSGVLVVIKPTQVELQFRGAEHKSMVEGVNKFTKEGAYIKNGVEYEITFGMYTINSTDVRAIMLVDGIELFNEVITDSALVNASAYFGVYATNETTVVIKTIEPVEATEDAYTSLTVDSMIDDAENWKDFKHGNADAATPVIDSTSVTVQGTSGNSLAGYNVAQKNVVYRFKYTQDITNGGYGGFYISLNQANNIPWNTRGVMITSSANYLAIQAFATAYNSTSFISQQDKDNKFESNKEYDIEFGFYDVSDTIVRVILKVDGEEIFNIPTDNEALRSATGYFGVITSGAAKVTLTKTGEVTPEPPEPSEPSTEPSTDPSEPSTEPSEPEETYTELTVDAMLADTANWKDFVWASSSSASPTFQNGSMSLKGTATNNLAGYNTAYKNTIYKFKYTHDYTNSGGSGFYINLTTPSNIPWNSRGIRVMSGSKLTLQAWKASTNTNKVIEETNETDMFVNGVTYEIEFGMYDISETEVRIILRVNGKEIFNVTSAEEVFRSATGYFGVEVSGSVVTATISGIQAVEA